jgi:hypothetical protein
MITVIGYKEGAEVRHEVCYDIFSADVKAEEFKDCMLYDEVHIVVTVESNDGTKKIV